jgi:hypothetical protein
MIDEETRTVNKLIDEMQRLKLGCQLLEEVFLGVGPYGDGEIPDELRYKINNFFYFDDSE